MVEDHSRLESHSPEATSFGQIDQDDEEEEEEHEPTPKPSRQQKGKGKAISRNDVRYQDEELENEVAQGLEDVEAEPESDASQEKRPVKKSKNAAETKRSKKENRRM
jgi:centromere protein C